MAGLLALGAAACGDDVQVVEPTPPVPPPPPAVTASMAPASASVLIGNSVVFAVNASGGVAGDAASWTCASSNSGIASVSVVSAGCQATGVAAGSVTITATVTKSGETVNVGAQLTVTEEATGEPAFIIIKGVTGEPATSGGSATDASGLKGRVKVNLGVERGDQTLERLSVLVDGEVAAYQSFGSSMDDGMGMAPPEDDAAAEQAVYDFTLSFDSDAYDEHGDHVDVDYSNGEHTISAELQIASGTMGHETITSNVMTVVFDNDDGFVVTADLGDNSALASDGKRWYGGPDNGHIEISALGVSYSGAEMGNATISLTGCTGEKAEGDGHGGDGAHAATEVAFEFKCTGDAANRTIGVATAGETATILNKDDLPKANIDMVAPANAPKIIANRNGRQEGWINAAVGLSGRFNAKTAKDNWLVRGDGGAGTGGVGGYNMGVRIGADLKKARAAATGSALPAESANNEAYCAIAVASDGLGNMATLPADTTTCRAAPDGEDVMVTLIVGTDTTKAYGYDSNDDDDNDNVAAADVSWSASHIEFGVDTTAPVVLLETDSTAIRFAALGSETGQLGSIDFEPADDLNNAGNSGLLDNLNTSDVTGDMGMQVQVRRRNASKTECAAVGANGTLRPGADKNCNYMRINDATVNFETDSVSVAYFTVNAQAKDKAGNTSSTTTHTLVYDNGPATATAPSVPGSIAAGKPFPGATYLNDNLSIRDYYGTMSYGDGIRLGIGGPQAVDAFNSSTFTRLNHPVSQNVGLVTTSGLLNPYAAIQTSQGSEGQRMSAVSVYVRDQAASTYATANTPIPSANFTGVPHDSLGFRAQGTEANQDAFSVAFHGLNDAAGDAADGYLVCGIAKCAKTGSLDASTATTLNVQYRFTRTEAGTFREPIERLDVWVVDHNNVAWLVGSDTAGSSDRVGGSGNNARFRRWTYSVTLPGTLINAATRYAEFGSGSPANETADIRVVAVKANGMAFSPATVEVTVNRTKPSS